MTVLDDLRAADTTKTGRYGIERWDIPWSNFVKGAYTTIAGYHADIIDNNLQLNDEEGEQTEVWVVFKVNGQYYKKTGYAGSYDVDDHYWDGPINYTAPKEVTVTVWE